MAGGAFASNRYRTRVGGFGRVGDYYQQYAAWVYTGAGCNSTGLKQTKYQPSGWSFPRPATAAAETNWISPSTCHNSNVQHPALTLSPSDNDDSDSRTSSH